MLDYKYADEKKMGRRKWWKVKENQVFGQKLHEFVINEYKQDRKIILSMNQLQAMRMKVKQIAFGQDQLKFMSKNRSQKLNRSVIRCSSFSNSKQNSPCFKNQTNKRLRHYSKRHKDSNTSIQNAQLQTLRQEFSKFDDNKIKRYLKLNSTYAKDFINLIAKNNHTSCKTQSSIQHLNYNNQINNQNLYLHDPVKIKQIIQVENAEITNPHQKIIQVSSLTQVNPFKKTDPISDQLFQTINSNEKWVRINQSLSPCPKNLSIPSTRSKNNKILVPEQRLSRHRFTKSSISRISYPEKKCIKINNFLSIDCVSPSSCLIRPATFDSSSKKYKNEFHSPPKTKRSKRYVKGEPSIKDECIDPYTNKRYLHVQLQSEKKHVKQIQRILQKSDVSNLKTSFQVKTINPETNTIISSRAQNRTIQEEFIRKVKNLGINVRKQLKKEKIKNQQKYFNEIHGWEIDAKSIAIDQTEAI